MNMQSSNKKILIFGGSFDPIHYGHLSALDAAINYVNPDLTVVVPNWLSPLKDTIITNPEHKLKMLQIALKDYDNLVIDDFEITQHQKSYFISTLNYLENKYKNAEFYLLIGSDQYFKFSIWKEYIQIISKIKKIIVFPRVVDKKDKKLFSLKWKYPLKFKFLNYNKIDISSTKIRTEYVDYTMVPKPVIEYINSNALYATERVEIRNSNKRFQHCLRVAYMAQELAKQYAPDLIKQAFCAGIYHDIAKDMIESQQKSIASQKLNIKDYPSWKVLHPYVGAYLLKNDFGFEDDLILNAIARHTMPFKGYKNPPNTLDKIIYVCDKLEPNRTDADVFLKPINYYRDLLKTDLDKCFDELYKDLNSKKDWK